MVFKNFWNIIFFYIIKLMLMIKINYVFFDVLKINVDVYICYLIEKYYYKNRDILKYKKKVGISLIM